MDFQREYECVCNKCEEYFMLKTAFPEPGEIYGVCPHCGNDEEHQITDPLDEPLRNGGDDEAYL